MPTLYSANVARGVAHHSASAARAPARSPRRKRGRGGGLPWFGVALLVLIGGAVFAARTVKLPRGAEPSVVEPTSLATAAVVVAAAKPATVRPTAVPTRGPVAAPTPPAAATPTSAARAGATSPPGPTHVTGAAATSVAVTPAAIAMTPTLTGAAPATHGASGDVALTFDAGADRGYAEDILDILLEHHIQASFGITGVWAKANPDLVRRMAADGHLILNHTLDHRSFTGVSDKLGGLSASRRRAELDDADLIIAPLIGHTTRPWYRLPYGDDDAQVAADVAPDGYLHKVGWTVDSLGWRGSSSADILARCLRLAASGGIYVFHVGRASQDALALPQVIAGLRDKGFGFRRVDQV